MAHGGSLTTNPHTGLPEAGFLSSLIPAAIGLALAPETGGASLGLTESWMAPALVGGGTALLTGNLGKGLMAGLGAYGGAQLAGGLAGLGTSEAGADIAAAAEAQGEQAAQQALQQRAAQQAAIEAAGQQAMTPQAIEAVAGQQAQLNALSPEAWAQSAKEAAVDAYTPTTAQQTALSNPFKTGLSSLMEDPTAEKAKKVGGGSWTGLAKTGAMAMAPELGAMMEQKPIPVAPSSGPNPYRYRFERGEANPFPQADRGGVEMSYFPNARYVQYAGGGPVEAMSNANAVGANTGFPMADISRGAYATPYQQPISQNVVTGTQDTQVDPYTGQERLARGGLSNLGDYSDGGRLLRGPGDGVSDSIPATIGNRRPARLADGEFVVPARIVSELGNGSTEAGARKLYAMMDRVQKARSKTVGKGKVAKRTNANNLMPA